MIADGLTIVAIYTWLRLLVLWWPLQHGTADLSGSQVFLRVLLGIGMVVIALLGLDIVLQAASGAQPVATPTFR